MGEPDRGGSAAVGCVGGEPSFVDALGRISLPKSSTTASCCGNRFGLKGADPPCGPKPCSLRLGPASPRGELNPFWRGGGLRERLRRWYTSSSSSSRADVQAPPRPLPPPPRRGSNPRIGGRPKSPPRRVSNPPRYPNSPLPLPRGPPRL